MLYVKGFVCIVSLYQMLYVKCLCVLSRYIRCYNVKYAYVVSLYQMLYVIGLCVLSRYIRCYMLNVCVCCLVISDGICSMFVCVVSLYHML